MGRARLILREKIIDEEGDTGTAPGNRASPVSSGVHPARRADPAVLYDNHDPKGRHRHLEGVEESYEFVDVDRLLADFAADVRRVIGGTKWPRH